MNRDEIREMFEKTVLKNSRPNKRYPLESDDDPDHEPHYVDDSAQWMWVGYLIAMESRYVSQLHRDMIMYRGIYFTTRNVNETI